MTEIDPMQEMYSAIASLARSQPDKPVIVIAMEHIADLKQLARDLYDVAARGGFDVGEESKFSERMAKLNEEDGDD